MNAKKNFFFILIFLIILFSSQIYSYNILKTVKIYNPKYYQLNLLFSKNIQKFDISANAKYLDIYFDNNVYNDFKFYLPISVGNNRIRINLRNTISSYKVKKYKNVINLILYKRDLKKEKKVAGKKQNKTSQTKIDKKNNSEKGKIRITKNKDIKPKSSEKKKIKKWNIIIDAGHGGRDPGAVGPGGIQEKGIVLSIAKKVYRILQKYNNFKLIMTRKTDSFVKLKNRAKIANNANGDLFVSIHANAIRGYKRRRKTKGIETYFLAEASSDRAREVAIRENASLKYEMKNYKNESMIKNILFDMADSQYKKESSEVAYSIQTNMINSIKSVDRGVQQAPFYVLRMVSMPSVLVEVGFVSHPTEVKYLLSDSYQNKIAQTIVKGIIEYFNKRGKIYAKK